PPGQGSGWLQADGRHALYMANLDTSPPLELGETESDVATWREDGQLLGLGRSASDAPLAVRLLSGGGDTAQRLVDLPLKLASQYAAFWDLRRARLLVTTRNAASGVDFWLVQLGLEGA